MMLPHILCIDGYNLIHRARSGFTAGDWPVVFNFFRSLRSEIERHKPTRVLFVTEGTPTKRIIQSNGTYKSNRQQIIDDEVIKFNLQKNVIIQTLKSYFPVSVMRHPNHEADDVIYNILKRSSSSIPWTILSTDTDFIQILNECDHVKIYNPVKKLFVKKPNYDYVKWKSLRGDPTDNIKNIPGIGDKTAEKLSLDEALFKRDISSNPERKAIFDDNYSMIKFHEFSNDELQDVQCSNPSINWDVVYKQFAEFKFQSMINDKSWTKFVKTFDHLWKKDET